MNSSHQSLAPFDAQQRNDVMISCVKCNNCLVAVNSFLYMHENVWNVNQGHCQKNMIESSKFEWKLTMWTVSRENLLFWAIVLCCNALLLVYWPWLPWCGNLLFHSFSIVIWLENSEKYYLSKSRFPKWNECNQMSVIGIPF